MTRAARSSEFIMEAIEKYPDFPWDWYRISENKNLTIKFVKKHGDKPWNWSFISEKIYARTVKTRLMQTGLIFESLVMATQCPKKVLQNLNKFGYSTGTDNLCE